MSASFPSAAETLRKEMHRVNDSARRPLASHKQGQRASLRTSVSVSSLWAVSPFIARRVMEHTPKQTYPYLETSQLFKLEKLPTRRKEPVRMDFNWLLVCLPGGGNGWAFGFRPCWAPTAGMNSSLTHTLSLLYFLINTASFRDRGTQL